jgi:hypothetical protein
VRRMSLVDLACFTYSHDMLILMLLGSTGHHALSASHLGVYAHEGDKVI